MRPKVLVSLLLTGPAFAYPPPPDSPLYVPPPPLVDVDFDDVLQRVLTGIWETQPNTPSFRLEITGRKPHHFKMRILTQPYCKALQIGRYALTVGLNVEGSAAEIRAMLGSAGFFATDHVTSAEIKLDGDRKRTNCLGMPAWISFKFGSPPNYGAARVTVREQFIQGANENEYEMTRHH